MTISIIRLLTERHANSMMRKQQQNCIKNPNLKKNEKDAHGGVNL